MIYASMPLLKRPSAPGVHGKPSGDVYGWARVDFGAGTDFCKSAKACACCAGCVEGRGRGGGAYGSHAKFSMSL